MARYIAESIMESACSAVKAIAITAVMRSLLSSFICSRGMYFKS